VLFNDFDWTPANHLQAEDRIHRIGQKNNCNILYMFAENAQIDKDLSLLIEDKLNNINAIIDKGNTSIFNDLLSKL
jgi:SNF2 family DNA or RNA helicase